MFVAAVSASAPICETQLVRSASAYFAYGWKSAFFSLSVKKARGLLLECENDLASTFCIKTRRHGGITGLVSSQREFAVFNFVNGVSRLANVLGEWTFGHDRIKLPWVGVFVKGIGGFIPLLRIGTVKLQLGPVKNKRGRTLGLESNFLPAPGPLKDERVWLG